MTIRIEPLGAAEAGLWRATLEVSRTPKWVLKRRQGWETALDADGMRSLPWRPWNR
jgi:hypothetical protein